MKYLLVIPARAGSKALPKKNFYLFVDMPLVCWTIKAALKSMVGDVVVTTDSQEIKSLIKQHDYPLTVVDRPAELAGDDVALAPVIIHAYEQMGREYDAIITLQPTSPLRTDRDISTAVERFEKGRADSLISVCEELHAIWQRNEKGEITAVKERNLNRQFEKPLYVVNGAIFITKTGLLLDSNNRIGGKIEVHIMPHWRSVDIHTLEDLRMGEYLYREAERKR